MTLKPFLAGVAAGALAVGIVWGAVALMAPSNRTAEASSIAFRAANANKGVLDLICELHLDLDGQLAMGITTNEPARMSIAQIDFDKSAGWYQGTFTISESRAGKLAVQGDILKVARPAMFRMFGKQITGEQFTVNRKTGEFIQTISIQDGTRIDLIKGICAKVIKPAF